MEQTPHWLEVSGLPETKSNNKYILSKMLAIKPNILTSSCSVVSDCDSPSRMKEPIHSRSIPGRDLP